jgi:hypothetical protein
MLLQRQQFHQALQARSYAWRARLSEHMPLPGTVCLTGPDVLQAQHMGMQGVVVP